MSERRSFGVSQILQLELPLIQLTDHQPPTSSLHPPLFPLSPFQLPLFGIKRLRINQPVSQSSPQDQVEGRVEILILLLPSSYAQLENKDSNNSLLRSFQSLFKTIFSILSFSFSTSRQSLSLSFHSLFSLSIPTASQLLPFLFNSALNLQVFNLCNLLSLS